LFQRETIERIRAVAIIQNLNKINALRILLRLTIWPLPCTPFKPE